MANHSTEENGSLEAGGAAAGMVHQPVLSVLPSSGPTLGIALLLHGGKSNRGPAPQSGADGAFCQAPAPCGPPARPCRLVTP
jgi:hypothetical protein